MPISEYLQDLRAKVGSQLLLMPAVAAMIRDDRGRVLLLRRQDDGTWGLPAGSIDPGESPAQAAAREVLEETGLRVVPRRVVGIFGGPDFRVTYPNGDVTEYTAILFECHIVGGTLEPVDGEALELRYFDPAAMPPLRYPAWIFESPPEDGPFFAWDDRWSSPP